MKTWVAIGFMLVSHLLQAQAPRLHYKPDDHALGDVHPFFHEGECYLYYLKPGGFDSMLVRSADWLNWTSTPLTHAPVAEGDWMARYFVLGVFRDPAANVFRSFHGHAQGRMASQESDDLRHWRCAPQAFHVPAGDYYERRRDPFVFWMPETKRYGCVMTAWIKGREKAKAGGVALATSADLQHWEDHGIVLDLVGQGEPECPQMFQIGPHWYLLTSIYKDQSVGGPAYYMAAKPQGPWRFMGALDGKDLCAAQFAADATGKLILFGWIPLSPATSSQQIWGGHLALAREIHALSDGRLATRLPDKLKQALDPLPWQSKSGISLNKAHRVDGEWLALAADMQFHAPAAAMITLDFPPLGRATIHSQTLRILDTEGTCWSEVAIDLTSTSEWNVWLFVEDDRVEVFLNEQYSLCARLPDPHPSSARRLFVQAEHPATVCTQLKTARLR